MAKNYGVNVKAYNISIEQIKYARERAKKEGLENQVEFIHDDYRTAKGEFDAFVSVGMLEHVGTDHYENLGNLIDSCLKESGYGLLHFIGRNQPMPMNAWIEKRIFPGAYPPSLAEAMQIFESGQFSVLDVENLRLHYAKTLEHWLEKYEQESDTIREMFDDEFVNSWRLYLAGSIAAFLIGDLQLFQISFVNTSNNNIQWTRDFLYSDNETKTRQEPKWKHVMS
jgi:cyclopropane-fatty-acyl-phospholipid synthase